MKTVKDAYDRDNNIKIDCYHTHICYNRKRKDFFAMYASDINSETTSIVCTVEEYMDYSIERKQNDKHDKTTAAISTLENLGYTHNGGEFWKPPIGKSESIAVKPIYTHELMVRGGTNTPEQYEPALKAFSGQKFSVFINQNGKEYVRKNSKVKFRLIDARTDEEKLVDEMKNIISKHCQDEGALTDLPKTLLEFYDITPK